MRRQLVLAITLAALAAAAWWYRRDPAGPEQPAPDAPDRPDYIVDSLQALTLDERGRPKQRLVTPQLRHYPADDSSALDQPRLTFYQDDGPPWKAHADHGWFAKDGEEVLLTGDAVISRNAFDANPPLQLRSSELLVLHEIEYAESDRFVELIRGRDWIIANDGMQVWYGEPLRLRLFGRARAVYHGPSNADEPGADTSGGRSGPPSPTAP